MLPAQVHAQNQETWGKLTERRTLIASSFRRVLAALFTGRDHFNVGRGHFGGNLYTDEHWAEASEDCPGMDQGEHHGAEEIPQLLRLTMVCHE